MINDGELTMGHARVLSKIEDNDKIIKMAHDIAQNGLTVRDIEMQSENVPKKIKIEKKPRVNEYQYVQDLLREKLDTKVKIKEKKIEISFTNDADLNRILEIINIKE
jgi:ParB family chromosome partitioning protein